MDSVLADIFTSFCPAMITASATSTYFEGHDFSSAFGFALYLSAPLLHGQYGPRFGTNPSNALQLWQLGNPLNMNDIQTEFSRKSLTWSALLGSIADSAREVIKVP
jgi:hypothetical protein